MPMCQRMRPVLFSSATSCRCVNSGCSVLRCCASSVAAATAMATPVSVFFMSEGQDDVREHVIERFVSFIDVDESLPRNERRGTADDDEVLVEIRPPAQAGGEVDAELRADVALEEQRFQRLRRVEPDVVAGEDGLEARRDFDVEAEARDLHAGIHELRLPFVLAAAQRREE